MNATLWVIWLSLLTLFGASGLYIGGRWFVAEDFIVDTWRDGYEQGADDELAACAPCELEHVPPPVIVPRLGEFIRPPVEWLSETGDEPETPLIFEDLVASWAGQLPRSAVTVS